MALLAGSTAVDARSIMNRVQNALARVLRRRQLDFAAIRIAVVTAPDHGNTVAELMAAADRAIEAQRNAATQQTS